MKYLKAVRVELFMWLGAIIYLLIIDPREQHFSFCIFRHFGWWCPGCGIGHSISFLLHGMLRESFARHPLGAFALLVFLHRIYVLLKIQLQQLNTIINSKTHSTYG